MGNLLRSSEGKRVRPCPDGQQSVHSADHRSQRLGGIGLQAASHDQRLSAEHLRALCDRLTTQLKDKDASITMYETMLREKFHELKEKDEQIMRLTIEVDKIKSVIHSASWLKQDSEPMSTINASPSPSFNGCIDGDRELNGAIDIRKQGVSGESTATAKGSLIELKKVDKDFRSKQMIKDAILGNNFLKNLDVMQIREMVDCMTTRRIKVGENVITEGSVGHYLYVSAEGQFEVLKDNKVLGRIGPGKAFGELAILYKCTRTASVKAVTNATVWSLDRREFQAIMMKTGLQRQAEAIRMLKLVPLLKDLPAAKLAKIADILELDFFNEGQYIIREGSVGDTFYIINKGQVKVTQTVEGQPQDVRLLDRGDYFGEQALIREERRTANVIALPPGVEAFTIDRAHFLSLIGDLSEIRLKDYGDRDRLNSRNSGSRSLTPVVNEYSHIRLEDLEVVATLGLGGFGRVELVCHSQERGLSFALKYLKKQHVVETRQQEHVYAEKEILMRTNNPFIVRMYKTFKDSKYVYMLMEACLGGEVWTILRDRNFFDDTTAKFYTACVVEALEYLHSIGVIYRDLKPENMLLDSRGNAKLVDFGFAKRLSNGHKTWTFCGTPEYVAPEIILNRGHDFAADYWSIGILMFELLTGSPPFTGNDPMRTYNCILKGIDSIEFPNNITRRAKHLIKRLCCENPVERLGYQRNGITDIKRHKWFQGFDWNGLRNQTLVPPIIPIVNSPTDCSNFDRYPKDNNIPVDEMSGWDSAF